MPPKKKKGKKSGKKRGERKSASKGATSEALSELSKEFYLIQIRDLETRLSRYQKKCDELEISSEKFKSGFDQQATDKKEIASFLKKQLEQRSDEIADLQERLIGLQQAKDTEKDQYELQISSLRTEMQEVKDQLTSENMVLGGKLASLEEFRVQREGLMQKFASMEDTLKNQECSHKDNVYKLEKKSVIDKDRLKKEMVIRVNTVASEFRKVSNKQIAETTKRTLRENVAINSQLAKMSGKTMELIKESDVLKDSGKETKLKLNLLEHNETELIKRNKSNLKIIKMLTDKAKQQQIEIEIYRKQQEELIEIKTTLDKQNEMNSENDYQIKCLENNIKELQEQNHTIDNLKQSAEGKTNQLLYALSHTVETLNQSLINNDNMDDNTRMRNTILESLISIMDIAAEENIGFPAADLAKFSLPGQFLRHYRIGDLGIVPFEASRLGPSTQYSLENLKRTASKNAQQKKPTKDVLKLPIIS